MAQDPFGGNPMRLFYWAPTDELWGHVSLALGDGTHISWWPAHEPGEHKKNPGMLPVALFTEWIDANQDQTLAKDTEYEGRIPAELVFLQRNIDQQAVKNWWRVFKARNKYQVVRLNCSTVVYLAMKHGGANQLVPDPGNWYWDPDRVLRYSMAVQKAQILARRGQVQLAPASAAATQYARVADQKAKKLPNPPDIQ